MHELINIIVHLFPQFIAILKHTCAYIALINYLIRNALLLFWVLLDLTQRKKVLQFLMNLYGRWTSIFSIELYFICNLTREEIYDFIILNLML